MSKKEKYMKEEAPIKYADSEVKETKNIEESVVEESKTEMLQENENLTSTPKESIPDSVFTNYVRVRIQGRHPLAGLRLMSVVKIANMIINNDGVYSVITSSNTANLVKRIIRERPDLLSTNLHSEYRENKIAKFENDLKRFKF